MRATNGLFYGKARSLKSNLLPRCCTARVHLHTHAHTHARARTRTHAHARTQTHARKRTHTHKLGETIGHCSRYDSSNIICPDIFFLKIFLLKSAALLSVLPFCIQYVQFTSDDSHVSADAVVWTFKKVCGNSITGCLQRTFCGGRFSSCLLPYLYVLKLSFR